MALSYECINFDELFESADKSTILIVNDLDPSLTRDRKLLRDQLITYYDGDCLSVTPECECGATKGGYNVGKVCQVCFTEVVFSTERDIRSTVWMAAPEHVHGFLNPEIYRILKTCMNVKGINLVDWILRLPLPKNISLDDNPGVLYLKKHGIQRGINAFYEQFDHFLEVAFANGTCSAGDNKKERKELKEWLIQERANIFCKHIPLPSRLAFVVEVEGNIGYVDKNFYRCMDAVTTITGLKLSEMNLDLSNPRVYSRVMKKREDRTALVTKQLHEFCTLMLSEDLGSKSGRIRKTLIGTRMHMTFRAVITSIYKPHHAQDIHLPWSLAVNAFSIHLKNKLLKAGYTPKQCSQEIARASLEYDPIIHEYLNEIITEHPAGKFPIFFQRNPTLDRLSAQQLYVTKIKDDFDDKSISLSLLVLRGANADFDGKQHCRR